VCLLSLDEQKNKYRALNDWFTTPLGGRVGEAMAHELMAVSHLLQGTTLLQLGVCGESQWLSSLTYRRKWLLTPCADAPEASLIASPNGLPLDRNSVDCIVAPFTMEAFKRDKNPLDEIDRVLNPMGYAVFFGVNPFSLWGGALYTGLLDCFGSNPAMLMSSLVLKQALLSRGYRQCKLSMFYYIPPVKQEFLLENFSFLNEMGKMIAPCPAGFYCLIVQKIQRSPPTLLQRAKRRRIAIRGEAVGLANSTHRS
jgi:hypothetical protein